MNPALLVVVIALLIGIQPITTDLYLPALPGITAGFSATVAEAQLTLTALLLPFGLSQLVWGPLSDRFGRKPVLMAGLAAYTVAGIGCALAPTMASLIAWRAVQGVAMGAAVMTARAVVRDAFEPQDGPRMMSKAQTGLGVIACLSAPLGGLLTDTAGWRWALAVLAVFGGATLLLVAARFRETLPVDRRAPLDLRAVFRNSATIARHPTFLACSLLSTLTYAGLFTFLAASSFIFIDVLGLTRTQYGLAMFSMSVAYISGTFLCRRLLPRLGLRRAVAVAGALSLAGGTAMGLLAWAGVRSPWALLVPFWVYMLGHGIHQPCGQTGAVAPFPRMAGAASALNGFMMMATAFLVGGWIGAHLDGTVTTLTHGVWFWSACLAGVAWTLMQRHGEPPKH